uniref:Auxilin-related protein 2 n=1 Tax=Auxenochlorella protothecoides TaxID=3075 RepID=A0A1D2A6Z2_AUXPR
MSNRSGGGGDALGSLLSGFSGLEGDILGRPKAMSDMKKQRQVSHRATPPRPETKSPVEAAAPFSVDDLEQLVQPRNPPRSASNISLSSSRPSVGSALNDFDALFSGPPTLTAPQPPASGTSLMDLGVSASPDPSDPFGMDLACPAPPSPSGQAAWEAGASPSDPARPSPRAQASGDDDLLPGFPSSQTLASPAAHRQHIPAESRGLDAREDAQPRRPAPRETSPCPHPGHGIPWTGDGASEARSPSPPGYLDVVGGAGRIASEEGWSPPRRPAPRPPGGSVLGGQPASPPQAPHALAAEVKQRAQRAFQGSAAWFMRAGKKLQESVRELQAPRPSSRPGSGAGGRGGGDAAALPAFYYDWAAQIARQSPRSQSATLGALGLEDRAVVQRIMDEAAAGERWAERRLREEGGLQRDDGEEDDDDVWERALPGARAARSDDEDEEAGDGAGWSYAHAGPPTARPPSLQHSPRGALGAEGPRPRAAPRAASYSHPAVASSSGGAGPGDEPRRPSSEQAARPAPPLYEDLLGVEGVAGGVQAAKHAAEDGAAWGPASCDGVGGAASGPAAADPQLDDLMGLGTDAAAPTSPAGGASAGLQHIDAMFTVGPPPPRAVARAAPSAAAAGAAQRPRSAPSGAGPAGWAGLGDALPAVDTSAYSDLYRDDEAGAAPADEPEERRRLRARRVADKHARMARGLAEARAREGAEAAEKAGRVALRDTLGPEMETWTAGKRDNIRALLSTMHTVLWPDSGWERPSISDMVEDAKVKRWYMKANLVVHPDKVRQKGGGVEAVARADMVFDILKAAWGKFEAARAR